jgi:RND family efflux transporter MFP subunit
MFLALMTLATLTSPARSTPPVEETECLVEPYLHVKISSGIAGIVDEVRVDRGDFVTKGQVLVTLKSDVERANYDLVKAKAAFAARKVERNKEMYRKQMISIHEKDEMETDLELLKLEVRESEERLKLRTITSPVNGVVVKRHFTSGEYVEDKPILDLAQIDPLHVEVVVPFRMYGQIKVGTMAKVTLEEPIQGVYPATVKVVDTVVDAASGTIGVRLELPNTKRTLPAGIKCTVRFPGGPDQQAGGK